MYVCIYLFMYVCIYACMHSARLPACVLSIFVYVCKYKNLLYTFVCLQYYAIIIAFQGRQLKKEREISRIMRYS
jgi:hypothetical protein